MLWAPPGPLPSGAYALWIRGNQATLGFFRKFLEWMRSHESERP